MGEDKKKEEVKNPVAENKEETSNTNDKKSNNDSKENTPPSSSSSPPPPPPAEIILKVYMHCEGCARKVRRCLKGFEGVEEVITDCKAYKVVVKGNNVDPLKVVDRIHKKTHRLVELLSPVPEPPAPVEENKVEDTESPKPKEIIQEPKVITVVLKVHMHCEACSLEIKKRIEKMKEVEEAIPDLNSSEVSVKGTFDPPKLLDYVSKHTGKHATIVKQDPPPQEKKEDDKDKNEKKGDGEGKKGKEEKNDEEGGGERVVVEEATMVELRRNEYYCYNYPSMYANDHGIEMKEYPSQMFSDENPHACSIM